MLFIAAKKLIPGIILADSMKESVSAVNLPDWWSWSFGLTVH